MQKSDLSRFVQLQNNRLFTIDAAPQKLSGSVRVDFQGTEYPLQLVEIQLRRASRDPNIELKTGSASLILESSGHITLSGTQLLIEGSGPVQINGKDVDIN